jgi:hypothetical protein
MATGLPTKEQVRERTNRDRHIQPEVEKRVALFLLGLTLAILAFLVYGSRSDLPEIQLHSMPVHILHHGGSLSGVM